MSKMKQIAALTAMLVGVIMYASPAKSAVCFLPDDDGSCGGGDIEISDGSDSDDNKPEEKCDGFTISAAEYEKMKDCFSFLSCTKSKNKEVKYKKGAQKENTTWSNGICCTGGTTYDSAEGKCCPAGGCTHECDAPKEWSSTLHSCECPKDREENTNHECCPVGEHADGAICCPEKKHNEGGKCVCDSKYNTDDDGNCVLPDNQTCDIIKNEYYSKDDCETDHPDTICNQNMSTKCWIGKCDTRSNTNYYETESACYDSYQDECYDCNLNPCEQVDEDTNCWFINCSKIGMYDRENECKENSSSGKCTFDNGLGCYNPVNEPICDKNESLYASEEECENWSDLLDGYDYCTKVGNCYKPASFVVSVSFAQPHCGYNPYGDDDCDWYGKTIFIRDGYSSGAAVDNSDYPTYRQLYAGKYTIRTEGQSTERKSGIGKFCRTSYVNKIELSGSDGTEINFDALSHGDEQDIARGDYPMTTATQKTHIFGQTLGGCTVKSNYYEFTMEYTFKPGVVYNLGLYDYIKNCEVPCY